jgi:hypothetical protein
MKGLLRVVLVVLPGLGPLAAQAPVHRIGVLGTSGLWHQTDMPGRLMISAPEGKTDVPPEPGHLRF